HADHVPDRCVGPAGGIRRAGAEPFRGPALDGHQPHDEVRPADVDAHRPRAAHAEAAGRSGPTRAISSPTAVIRAAPPRRGPRAPRTAHAPPRSTACILRGRRPGTYRGRAGGTRSGNTACTAARGRSPACPVRRSGALPPDPRAPTD